LYIGNLYQPHKKEIHKFLNKLRINGRKVELVQFDTIMTCLLNEVIEKGIPYENDSAIQTIKILHELDLLKG